MPYEDTFVFLAKHALYRLFSML